jgi:hypothetical protein
MKNLESLLMQVFEYKKQLFALAREIISSINTLQSKFMKVERYLGLNIFEVQTNNRFYWNIKANPSEFIEKNLNFSSFEIISKYLKKKLSSSKIFKISESFKNLLKKRLEFDLVPLKNHEDQLYFCSDETTSLFCFDTRQEKTTFLPFEENHLRRRSPAICPLENNKIFIYGGWNEKALKSALIVDISSKTLKKTSDGIRRSQASAQLLKNRVYIFAGCTSAEVFTTESSYFDLVKENWKKISNFPISTRNTSTLLQGSKILITSSENSLVTYESDSDTYKTVKLNFMINTINLLFSHEDSVYLISTPHIYKSSKPDLKTWKVVQSCSVKNTTTSKPVHSPDSNFLFFSDSKRKIYKLDLRSFFLKKLSN